MPKTHLTVIPAETGNHFETCDMFAMKANHSKSQSTEKPTI